MKVVTAAAALCLLSFVFGWTNSTRLAEAAVPAACPKYECKTVHAVWFPAQLDVTVYMVPGMMTNSDCAEENLFTPNSVEKKPLVNNGNYDTWSFPQCNPLCGKDAAGKWQGKQEVAKAGNGMKLMLSLNLQRKVCTATGGPEGPKAGNQDNDNTEGKTPPGVTGNEQPPIE